MEGLLVFIGDQQIPVRVAHAPGAVLPGLPEHRHAAAEGQRLTRVRGERGPAPLIDGLDPSPAADQGDPLPEGPRLLVLEPGKQPPLLVHVGPQALGQEQPDAVVKGARAVIFCRDDHLPLRGDEAPGFRAVPVSEAYGGQPIGEGLRPVKLKFDSQSAPLVPVAQAPGRGGKAKRPVLVPDPFAGLRCGNAAAVIAVGQVHPGVGNGTDLPSAGVHHQIGPGQVLFALRRLQGLHCRHGRHGLSLFGGLIRRARHGDHGQPLAELDALALPELRLGEGGQLLSRPVQEHQRPGGVHGEGASLGKGERLPVLHGDRQHAAGVHIAEPAALEAGRLSAAGLLPRQGDGGHPAAVGAHGGVVGLQQRTAVRAVEAVETVPADGVDIFLTAVGDYLVYPQADQLLHRRVSGRGEAQAQQPGQRQGKQLSFHHQVPFQHGFIRQTGTPAILYLFCSNFTRCRRILQGSPAIRNGIVTEKCRITP